MLMNSSSQPVSNRLPALACALAAILWGVFWYPLRLLEDMGLNGLWSTLFIYCVAGLFIVLPCWRSRQHFLENSVEYCLIALFAGWTNLAFILAMLEGEVVRVLLLFYLSPVWAILMATTILKERLTPNNRIALLLAMLGVVLMLWQPDIDLTESFSLADCYALTSGLGFAMTNIVVRKMGTTPVLMKMGSAWVGAILLTLLGLGFTQAPAPEMTMYSGLLVFLLGFPFIYIMTWMAQYGVTYLPIQRSSILFLLEIIAGAVSAAFLTNEIVSNREYLGGVLIIAAGLISVMKEKKQD